MLFFFKFQEHQHRHPKLLRRKSRSAKKRGRSWQWRKVSAEKFPVSVSYTSIQTKMDDSRLLELYSLNWVKFKCAEMIIIFFSLRADAIRTQSTIESVIPPAKNPVKPLTEADLVTEQSGPGSWYWNMYYSFKAIDSLIFTYFSLCKYFIATHLKTKEILMNQW